MPANFPIGQLISGGQTGVDRAALDTGLGLGIPSAGWCPQGRWAEDGRLAPRYPLSETQSSDPAVRTRLNVMRADGTLVLHLGRLDPGSRLTLDIARSAGRPFLEAELGEAGLTARVRLWLAGNKIRALNIAGPRESSAPGIQLAAEDFLRELLADEGKG